jgi:hypothetical protein
MAGFTFRTPLTDRKFIPLLETLRKSLDAKIMKIQRGNPLNSETNFVMQDAVNSDSASKGGLILIR